MTAGAENADEKAADDSGGERAGSVRDDGLRRNGRVCADGVRVSEVAPIPGQIVKAICAIQATVEAVKKSQRNQDGGYQFASTDDIYAAVTRKMGEVGLVLMSLEDKVEIKRVEKDGKTSQWAHFEFSFVLATEDATWSDARAKRTLYIQVTGPQTFQAAQSYAEKAYLRSLFKMPTGDMDLDSMPQADNEDEQVALNSPKKRKSSYQAKKDADDVPFNELRGAISSADGPADLVQIRKDNWSFWSQLPGRWREIVDNEYDDRMKEFGIETDQAAE